MAETPDQYTLQDPRTQYPRPPFPRQPQDAPGTIFEMEPKPDHGEDSYRGFGRMEGRKALITGGDSGIGRAVAIAYAREGAAVAINYLPEEEDDAESLRQLIEGEGGTLVKMPGDVTDEAFCRELVDGAADTLGGLDVVVINAGKQVYQEHIRDVSSEQFDQTYKTNVYAMFWMAKAAVGHLPPGGSILTVSSIQGYKPSAGLLDYASTKWAMIGFTKALAKQLAGDGIRVNAVAPGPFWTPLQPSGGQPQDKIEEFGAQVPLGRPGQPAEIAPTFVFLATQEAGYITGEVVGVTGGDPTA